MTLLTFALTDAPLTSRLPAVRANEHETLDTPRTRLEVLGHGKRVGTP
jgi:hypothetical protein